ncbi:hypothetical protein K2Q08_00575 [Patescibacteria group bacterium]|nr:hypothetical protein [Patescibacteria group bacterium]
MKIFRPNSVADYLGALFVMVVFFIGFVSFWYILKQPTNTSSLGQNTPARPLVSCASDFSSYNELRKKPEHVAELISEKNSLHAVNGKFPNSKVVITKNETTTSKVACGYLFVRAGTENEGALKNWENVVIVANGFGGHLISSSAISVNDGSNFSEYLYALNKIDYWDNHNHQNKYTADWTALLNVTNVVPFTIDLNTENETGFISNVSIAYKCWNPETGEENDGCSLKVQQ